MNNILFISLFILVFFNNNQNAYGRKIIFPNDVIVNIGDSCEDHGYMGTIQRFVNCDLAKTYLKESNIYPKIFYFDKFEPIVCCMEEVKFDKAILASRLDFQNSVDGTIFSIEPKLTDNIKNATTEMPLYFELVETTCTTEGKRGILSQYRECEPAIVQFKQQAIRPEIFTFKGLEPIICCVK